VRGDTPSVRKDGICAARTHTARKAGAACHGDDAPAQRAKKHSARPPPCMYHTAPAKRKDGPHARWDGLAGAT
jgi:hypothetical protein